MPEMITVCPSCGATIKKGKTMFSAEIGESILVIKEVPADICVQCGDKWFSDEVMAKIEGIAEDVRNKHAIFEVINFNAA